ncbi:MAG: MFS transporter [Cyanobacteria bacterium J06639_16]
MRTFLMIWVGQFASLLGSEMTNFAITIWAWEMTGQATPLSSILAVSQIPKLLISPFVGVWVDRFNRKSLMLLGDLVAGLSTLGLLALFLTDHLLIEHLYWSSAINGLFGYVQKLAYSASISSLVTQAHYTRVSALESLQLSGSYILVPALAASIYAVTGLSGILVIDIVTFVGAMSTLSFVTLPQPSFTNSNSATTAGLQPFFDQLTFGLRYLWQRPSLRTLLGFFLISNFIDSASFAILPAMVLARSNNNVALWGNLFALFGLGGILGGLTISIWGGPKRHIHGVLMANAVWKGGLIVLALAQRTWLKVGTALVSGFCSPFPDSSNQALWMSKVEPEVQGRVFATRFLMTQLATPLGAAIAGPLADRVFEPAMRSQEPLAKVLGGIFGTGLGAGMAVQMALFASCGVMIALGGYKVRRLRELEI